MKLVFIADFFIDEILGGGELNNDELIKIFKQRGHEVISAKSATTNASFIEANKESCFIVANFIMLSDACKKALEDKNYIIY